MIQRGKQHSKLYAPYQRNSKIFQNLPHRLLQVKDSTKIGEKTNSLHIYINRTNLCFCIHHCSMRKYQSINLLRLTSE